MCMANTAQFKKLMQQIQVIRPPKHRLATFGPSQLTYRLVTDVPVFKSAIDAREALCATAIGDEIAIPHAKIPGIPAFFVMTAVMRNGVEWDAPDQKPVRIVFLIGGPDNDQKAYLGLLGKILKTVKNADRKECLFRSGSTAEIASILTQ